MHLRWMSFFSYNLRKNGTVFSMTKQTITELKRMFQNGEMDEDKIEELKNDGRKGVQNLIQTYERQKEKEKSLEIQFHAMRELEQRAFRLGNTYIAGVDEAGRGPLAGPVVAAAVILPEQFKLLGLNDSKQLNEKTREQYDQIIRNEAISYGISIIDNQTIDEINIFEATKLAMYQAINQLEIYPDHVLLDAVRLEQLSCTSESIIKGDAKSVSIAAASVLAKVKRDQIMKKLHMEYPDYDFASNMGYGTALHIQKLKELGPTPYHRLSFGPVKEAAANLRGSYN